MPQKGKILPKGRNLKVFNIFQDIAETRSLKDEIVLGHWNCKMRHFIPLQGEDVSFLAQSFS